MPVMAGAAPVPAAQRHPPGEHIAQLDARRQGKRAQGHRLHRPLPAQGDPWQPLAQPAADQRHPTAAAHRQHCIDPPEIQPLTPGRGGDRLQQGVQFRQQAPLGEQRLQAATIQAQLQRGSACVAGQLQQLLVLPFAAAEAALKPLRRLQQRGIEGSVRSQRCRDPAVDVAAPKRQTRLAEHPGGAQGLALRFQIPPREAQQLGDRRRPPLPSLQGHQRDVDRAATQVDHQHAAARRQTGTDRRGGGLIHQRHLGHRQVAAHLLQPGPVAAIGLDRGGEHQPGGLHLRRQSLPEPSHQQGGRSLGRQPWTAGALGKIRRRGADAALEVTAEARPRILQQVGVEHLLADQRPGILRVPQPENARDQRRIGGAVRRQRQQPWQLPRRLPGHHRGAAAQIEGQGAGHAWRPHSARRRAVLAAERRDGEALA